MVVKSFMKSWKDGDFEDIGFKQQYDIFNYVKKNLDENIFRRLITVGRLDEDTTGLLIVTTDGKIVDKISNPESHISKKYLVKTELEITMEEILAIKKGIKIQIFDEDKIIATATYDDAKQFPVGIPYVIVNGSIAVNNEVCTGVFAGQAVP